MSKKSDLDPVATIKVQDIEAIVKKLNYELYDEMQDMVEEYAIVPLILESSGDYIGIRLFGIFIWTSEDDPFEESTPARRRNPKARLEMHLREKINDFITKISKIVL